MIRSALSHKNFEKPAPRQANFGLVLVFVGAAIFLSNILIPLTGGAQESTIQPSVTQEVRDQLKQIEASIVLRQEKVEKLQKEMERLATDRTRQTADLIAAAQRVKLAEIEVGALEENLSSLLAEEAIISKRLAGTNSEISGLLAALQRLGRAPAPALLVSPGDAVGSARSAILISALLPQLRQRAALISTDLEKLISVRERAEKEENQFRANLEVLAEEQLRIAVLIEAREKGMTNIGEQLRTEIQQAEKMALEAKSLEELVTSLKSNNETLSPEVVENETPVLPEPATPEDIATAFANTKRTRPAISFDRAEGYLTLPAAGVLVNKFGSDDGFGGKSKGISIVTRADAQVISPGDGWVIYKGPYLNYGEIIIINPGNDYTILLAGLETTNVEQGQFILRGEPIGVMGKRTIGEAIATSAGISRPTLYIELRNQDIPLDPSNWWQKTTRTTTSG